MQHSERKHALLSASGASRWINCTPSARLEEERPDPGSSVFAEEGTLAHEFADLELRIKTHVGDVGPRSKYRKWKTQQERLKKHKLFRNEMLDYVAIYTSYVLEQYMQACKENPGAIIKIEERTDFSYLVPEGFGTSDANIINDGVLEIVDLKYGKGLKVDALGNPQMRLYALGLLRKFDLVYDIHTVKMTIVQPRLDHIDTETLSVGELQKWSVETVKPAALRAYDGLGDQNPGSWCKWCRVKPVCRGLANHNLNLAKMEFADPHTLTDVEVVEVYKQSQLLVDWANSVATYMLDEAVQGKKWDGYKLVEGRSVRKWADEKKAIEELVKSYKKDEILNTKLKGIGDIEKLAGKGKVNHLLIKPPGKPTLAPESDKRPALGIDQAKKDFDK